MVLSVSPQLTVKPGMISDSFYSVSHQHFRQLFCGLTVKGVDDAAFAFVLLNKTDNTFIGLLQVDLGLDLVIKIWPVKRGNKNIRFAKSQVLYNITLHFWCGSCGKCDDGDMLVDHIHHFTQPAVLGPEIMSPLRNAMRFINREKRNFQVLEKNDILFLGHRLRRNVKHFCLAAHEIVLHDLLLTLI